jgi:hypothetical protein
MKKIKTARNRQCTASLFFMLSACSLSAFGAETAVQVTSSAVSDSNVFRFYDGQAAAAQNGNSSTGDRILQADVSAGVIVPLASNETRLILSGSLGTQEFKNYRQLDNQPKAGNAVFEWVAYDVLAGKVSTGDDKRLFQYINGSLTQKDVTDTRQSSAEIRLKITQDLSIPVKFEKNSLSYDLPQNLVYNTDQTARQIGLRYTSGTGSTFETGLRYSTTTYPDRTPLQIATMDNRYSDTEAYVEADWKYSVKTSLFAHIGMLDRKYENLTDRNQRLFSALVHGTYLYSPKLRLDMQLWDAPYSISDQTVLYVVAQGLRLDAIWDYSEKTQFRLFGMTQRADNHLLASVASGTTAPSAQTTRTGVTINYNADRDFRLFFSGFYERLHQDDGFPGLSQGVLKLGLEYTFENIAGSANRIGLTRYQTPLSNYEPTN